MIPTVQVTVTLRSALGKSPLIIPEQWSSVTAMPRYCQLEAVTLHRSV